ncbi:MAG: DUF5615 family PIN-like protein [Opitutales bacterium]
MRLLFDQHISRRVVRLLKDTFPESHHVKYFQLEQASDEEIWDFAKHNGYTIVTKDDDFHQKSLLLGTPPKVVWVKLGNADNQTLETFLRARAETIHNFLLDENASLLVLNTAELTSSCPPPTLQFSSFQFSRSKAKTLHSSQSEGRAVFGSPVLQ